MRNTFEKHTPRYKETFGESWRLFGASDTLNAHFRWWVAIMSEWSLAWNLGPDDELLQFYQTTPPQEARENGWWVWELATRELQGAFDPNMASDDQKEVSLFYDIPDLPDWVPVNTADALDVSERPWSQIGPFEMVGEQQYWDPSLESRSDASKRLETLFRESRKMYLDAVEDAVSDHPPHHCLIGSLSMKPFWEQHFDWLVRNRVAKTESLAQIARTVGCGYDPASYKPEVGRKVKALSRFLYLPD
jgi:hypothetical protein